MTDMVAKPVSLKNMLSDRFDINNYLSAQEISNLNLMSEDIEVHAGMAEAAIYIFQQVCIVITKEKTVFQKSYTLVGIAPI